MKSIVVGDKEVKIEESVESDVIDFMKSYDREVGGIIGSYKGVICTFIPDNVNEQSDIHEYNPDTSYLRNILISWRDKGIVFEGIVHSHLEKKTLSYGDILFAKRIAIINDMESVLMPIYVKHLDKIIWYSISKELEGFF